MGRPLRVLIIEESDRDAASEILELEKAGYQITHELVSTDEEMEAVLHSRPFDLVIANHNLPQFDSFQSLTILKKSGLDIPFLVVSGSVGEEMAAQIMKAGAQDLVVKSNLSRLGTVVEQELQDAEERRKRKKAEEALMHSQELLKETQALGQIGSWQFDVETQTITWSEQTYALYERDPKMGPPSQEEEARYYLPEQAKVIRDCAANAIETGQSCSIDFEAKLPSGKLAYFHTIMKPVKNSEGRTVKLSGIVQDITERKRAEQVKDEFIGLVSHEIRTPLTILMGAIGTMMQKGISVEDAQILLADALDGAESLNLIVNNMIELSRYQSARLALAKTPINIEEVVMNLAEKEKLHASRHRLVIDIPEGLPPVSADKIRIELILANLLSNAIKYSPEGKEIRISVRQLPDNLVISVTDQGIGIPLEQQSSLFQAFERLENPTIPTKGLGLGLLVCKRLVEAHAPPDRRAASSRIPPAARWLAGTSKRR